MKIKPYILIPVVLLGLSLIFLLVVLISYPIRVSVLCSLGTNACGRGFSTDGKWTLGRLYWDKTPEEIIITSTDLPFRRIAVDLPKTILGIGYSVKDPGIWSPTKNAFILTPMNEFGRPGGELEIVQTNPDGTWKVSTYSEPDINQKTIYGNSTWSVQGDRVASYYYVDKNTLRVTVLNLNAEVIKTFDFHKWDTNGWIGSLEWPHIIFDDTTIFLSFHQKPGEKLSSSDISKWRTKIYSFPMENPEEAELLMDEPGYYGLFSYDQNNKLMVFKFNDEYRHTDQAEILDIKSHKVVEEVPIKKFFGNLVEIINYGDICSNNCTSTAADTYFLEQAIKLIWSWKDHQFSYLPNTYGIYGFNQPINDFLCLNDSISRKYNIHWYEVCK